MLINCPECHKRVSKDAEACPHCGVKIKGTKAAEESANAETTVSIGCGAIILIFFAWLFWPSSGNDSGTAPKQAKPAHSESGAYVVCKNFVKERLKSPKSADFPWLRDEFVARLGGARYRVDAYVDAQNSFGADLRNHFSCTVRWLDGNRWRLEDLKIQ